MNGSQWNANASEVLLQDGGTRPASTSGRWITPLGTTLAEPLNSSRKQQRRRRVTAEQTDCDALLKGKTFKE